MALTKSGSLRSIQSSTSNAASGTTTTSLFSIGYGVECVVTITNGGTGPTIPCTCYVVWSADGSAVTDKVPVGSGDTVASSVTTFTVQFGIGGSGGDSNNYGLIFTGNTGQGVTVKAQDTSTTLVA